MALLRSAREDGQAEGGRRGTHPPVERGQGGGGGPDREGEVKRVQGAEGHPRGHQNSLRVAVRLRDHRKAKEEPFFHVGEKATIDARADGVGKAPLSLTASDRRRDLGQCEVGDEEVLPSHERAIEDGAFRLGKIDLRQRARVEVDGPGDGEGSPGHWLLSALLAVFADRGGQRGVEGGKGAPECAASREAPSQSPRGGHESCDGLSPVGQDQLVAAPHLLDQGREVLARFADAGSLHATNVLHVAHRVKRKEGPRRAPTGGTLVPGMIGAGPTQPSAAGPAAETATPSPDVRRRLEEVFDRERVAGIVSAYLFGSHAEGRTHRESDVDVGILFDRATVPSVTDRSAARVTLGSWLVGALSHNEVDVVVLNDAPPLLGRKIVTNGIRVFCADAEKDLAFVRDVQLRAADLEPFLRKHSRTLLQAITR